VSNRTRLRAILRDSIAASYAAFNRDSQAKTWRRRRVSEKSPKDCWGRHNEFRRYRPLKMIREVMRYRDLLYMMTWRDIRIKYKQSILGVLWAILMPAMIVLAGVAVKVVLSRVTGKPLSAQDVANVSVRAIPWAFFIASIRFGTNCLVSNANLVTKIYFPRVIFPLSATLSQFVDFLIACGVLAIVLVFLGLPLSWGLLSLPFLIAMLVALAAGLAIFLSAASLFFRDVKYLVEMFLTFAIFFTPVFFDVGMFGEWKNLLLLNPVAPILEGISAAVTGQGGIQAVWLLYSVLVSLSIFGGSVLFFAKVEPLFAECI
jgi:lipopolysaccharide transport system permease protein